MHSCVLFVRDARVPTSHFGDDSRHPAPASLRAARFRHPRIPRRAVLSRRSALPQKTLKEWFSGNMDSFIGSSGNVLMWTVRIIFLALIFGIAGQAMVLYEFRVPEAYISGALIAGVGVAVLFGDILIRNKQITTISAIYFGLLMGFLLGHLLGSALQPFIQGYIEPITRESPTVGQNLVRLITVCFVLICC